MAKILDYSKLRYREEKERRNEKAHQKKIEVKGIRLSLRISEHDRDVRVNQAQKFLADGDKVRIEMQLRGREMQHADLARDILKKFINALNTVKPVKVEQPLSMQGGKFSVIVSY